jgi:hypothetical protein
MRARYYASELGRFQSEDTASDGANWFTYCLNNPVNFLDEDGKRALNDNEQSWLRRGNEATVAALMFCILALPFPPFISGPMFAIAFSAAVYAVFCHSMALGLNDGRSLMFMGLFGSLLGVLSGVLVACILSAYKLTLVPTLGISLAGLVLCYSISLIAGVFMCDQL